MLALTLRDRVAGVSLVDDATRGARVRRALEGGGRGLAFGLGANLVFLRFVPAVIARFTPLPWAVGLLALVLLAAAQSLAWAACGVVFVRLARVGAPRALAFAIAALVAALVPCVFPWSPAGALTPWPAMVQLADVIGERGVTALVAFTAALLADAFAMRSTPRRALVRLAFAAALLLLTAAHGRHRIAAVARLRASARTAKVALLQPSIGAAARWKEANGPPILEGLTSLTRSAERRGAELTVWPEAAYPYVLNHAARRTPFGPWAILQPEVRGPVLTGAVLSAGHGDSYNSAIVVNGSGDVSPPYDKLHLLWFGEAVPLAAQLPWMRRTFARGIGMVPGERSVILEAGQVRAGILICFEDILPEAGREAAAGGPNLLVDISNDAWFTGSDESEEHLQLAVLRAVETRRDLVRAVNSGPTSWVDAAGVVRARYASDLPGLLLAEPALLETPPTPYVRLGDVPLITLALIVVAALVVHRRRAPITPAEERIP
jgi:apolipoprotein N-acyltransferase